ncbi:MAG: glycine cleavage system aminomethyltransferase GcvT [Dehalococcoidia bacterium]
MSDPPENLRRTALYDQHREQGGKMVPFAGWQMPIQYRGIVDEHNAVRQDAGVFDVSHMMRAWVTGRQAAEAVRSILTYDVTHLQPGRGHYTLMCTEDAGILDDPYVYRLEPERLLFVGNAANGDRDWTAVEHAVSHFDARAELATEETVMLAVQGPNAIEKSVSVVGDALSAIKKRRCIEVDWDDSSLFVSRTGYTGEDGFEFVTDAESGRKLWQALLAAGVAPAALGARDTLRLEAALALYGNDIDESTNPYEARLGWVVSLDDEAPFMGRQALVDLSQDEPQSLLTCLKATERGVPRDGYPVFVQDSEQGHVTSGGFSPTLNAGIAMAYLQRHLSNPGTAVQIDVRGRPLPAEVVERPFYRAAF